MFGHDEEISEKLLKTSKWAGTMQDSGRGKTGERDGAGQRGLDPERRV